MPPKLLLYIIGLPFLLLSASNLRVDENIKIFSIGNGNMADRPMTSNDRGWMQMMPMFFGLNVQLENYAVREKSAKAFLDEGDWKAVINLVKEGDYVFISFNNDQQTGDDGKEFYQRTLTQFIRDVKQKKGIPMLITPIVIHKNSDATEDLIKGISEKENIDFIDLRKQTQHIFEHQRQKENNELSVNEAIKVAEIAAQSVKNTLVNFTVSGRPTITSGENPFPVFANKPTDILASTLREEAALQFNLRQLPVSKSGWEAYRKNLRNDLIKSSGVEINHSLPLDIRETGSIQMKGYTIKKIYFQTRPKVYATANLYVPDEKGIFPAIINLHGHWPNGKSGEMVQSRAHQLALNGYVCLNIDAWGTGERTTRHGIEEYHGSNLGASLMNIGETLLGNQLTDNIRGVDLLCSLPYVDKNNIGATGASGGGNQTMWLSALDERIKACMPVVSVGTFQSYIMGSNCICELMPGGLTHTEESGILALIAPRSLKICNALKDANPTFYPSEMLRSYSIAKPIFDLYNVEHNINYQLFNTPHGYWPEMRQVMLGWFDLKLKGTGDGGVKKEIPFTLLSNEQLMVFPKGKRDPLVMNTSDYCSQKGQELSNAFYKKEIIDKEKKLKELHDILLLGDTLNVVKKVHQYEKKDGWHRIVLETNSRHHIPLKFFPSVNIRPPAVILLSDNKNAVEENIIQDYIKKGYSVFVADVWGKGEGASSEARKRDGRLPEFHTLARAELWLGKTILGEWVKDIHALVQYVRKTGSYSSLTIDAYREISVASLMQSAFYNNVDTCVLRTSPISYGLERREGIDFFNMAIHLPGILKWGDISLIAALNQQTTIIFQRPVSITGKIITGRQLSDYKMKFSGIKDSLKSKSSVYFSG